jgi:hypothetical protein
MQAVTAVRLAQSHDWGRPKAALSELVAGAPEGGGVAGGLGRRRRTRRAIACNSWPNRKASTPSHGQQTRTANAHNVNRSQRFGFQ